jgi:hypothetical protein
MKDGTDMRSLIGIVALVSAVIAWPSAASAQDGRWAAWLGCWDRVVEDLREPIQPAGELTGDPAPARDAVAPRVCVTRSGDAAVTLTTTVPGQPPIEQTLVPDGKPQPVAENQCRGTEQTEWSANGQRLFARAEVTCADGTMRTISGLAMITADGEWLDIRSVRLGEIPSTRVSRYRRAAPDASVRIPPLSGAPLSLAEVREASGKVSPSVLEAAIAETNPYLPVNRRTLTELANAGVAPSVLDVIVAMAYPDKFVVERTGVVASASVPGGSGGPGAIDDYYQTGFYYPAYYYSPFAYSYLGMYDPFLYRPYGYIGSLGGGGGVAVIDGDLVPSGRARAVNNSGYTRIRAADEGSAVPRNSSGSATSGGSSGSVGSARTRSVVSPSGFSNSGPPPSSGGGASGSSGGDSGGGSSGGASSGGGSSSGGGGSDTGRTAVPR